MIETKSILVQALSEALGKMAFLAILPMEDEMVTPRETIWTEIRFSGPQNGTLQVLAGRDFGNILAENIGAVCEVDEESRCDALKELVNVTCGLLLPLLTCSPQDVFDVTVPKTTQGEDLPLWQAFTEDENSHVVNVEGHLVAARLTIQ